MQSITIENHNIGDGNKPLMVVEIAPSRDRSLKRALEIVDAAAAAGARGVKIRSCKAANNVSTAVNGDNSEATAVESPKHPAEIPVIPREWQSAILARCAQHGMICLGSPGDMDSLVFLESLGIPCYKIDAQNNQSFELIRKVAATGKPVVVSTGEIELPDLVKCVAAVKNEGSNKLILMKSSNPEPESNSPANINTLPHMQHIFRCMVGLSDFTRGTGAAIASVAIGASIIEKQLTLSRTEDGTDSLCALEPHELKKLVADTDAAWQALGSVHYGPARSAADQLKSHNAPSPDSANEVDSLIPLDNIHTIRPDLEPTGKHPDRH